MCIEWKMATETSEFLCMVEMYAWYPGGESTQTKLNLEANCGIEGQPKN